MSHKEQKVFLTFKKQLQDNIDQYQKELAECDTENTQKKELLNGFIQKLQEQMDALDKNIEQNFQKIQEKEKQEQLPQSKEDIQQKQEQPEIKNPQITITLPENPKQNNSELNKLSILSDLSKSVISRDNTLKQRNLIQLFNFYLKLLYSPGVVKEFGSISHDLEVMSFGKYMVMCRQLGILDTRSVKNDEKSFQKSQSKTTLESSPLSSITPKKNTYFQKQEDLKRGLYRLSRQQVTAIFKNKSAQLKEINFKEFQYILKEIGWLMYNNNQSRSEDDCQQLFQTEILKLHLGQYTNYLQSLNSAFFSNEKLGQTNEGDRIQQKKEIDEHKKMLIEEWRYQKSQNLTNRSNISNKTNAQPVSHNLQRRQFEKQNKNYSQLGAFKSKCAIQRFQQQMTWESLTKLNHIEGFLSEGDNFNPQELIEETPADFEYTMNKISMKKRQNQMNQLQISKSAVNIDNRYIEYGSREQGYSYKSRNINTKSSNNQEHFYGYSFEVKFMHQKNISGDIFRKIQDLQNEEKQKYSFQKLYPGKFIQY